MSSTNPVLSDRDVNAPVGSSADGAQPAQTGGGQAAGTSLEYQRQMFRARLGDEKYVYPGEAQHKSSISVFLLQILCPITQAGPLLFSSPISTTHHPS
jgi:hypothetical protein